MKRIICILALCLGLIALMTSCSFFSLGTEGLEYIELEDGSYAVKAGGAIDLEEIVIPNTYNGKPVTQIAAEGFKEASNLKDVTIPKNVTVIGESAFDRCWGLTEIVIPNSVKTIGYEGFYLCTGLKSVTIGSGVTTIEERAFYECRGVESITSLASTAPSIESYTFYNVKTNGTLYMPQGATGYDEWLSSDNYYLGFYNWNKTSIISFSVGDETFQAEEGMTFEQWVDSDYNIHGWEFVYVIGNQMECLCVAVQDEQQFIIVEGENGICMKEDVIGHGDEYETTTGYNYEPV